ncbi:MAG: NAD-dependent epimerase/dehydratase family protein [bacterium]
MREELKKFAGKTVLITGATGFSGRVLTRKLAEAGAIIRVIARKSSSRGDLKKLDVTWFRGDVYDPEIVQQATQGVHYIFHLAAAFRETHPDEEGYRKVHLYSTQLLAKAVAGQPEFECFLHVSTVGVHGHVEHGYANESYRFAPGDSYQRTKLEAELWLAQYGKETGLPFSIIRPSPIFGPGDMRLLKIFRMVSKGFFMMLGKGKGWYHLVHVDDLTNVMMLAAVIPEARSEAFIAANDEPIAMTNMAKLIGKKIDRKVRVIRLPLWPFYLASDICTAICGPLGIPPPIYRRRVDFYTKDRIFDNTKIKKTLHYQFKYDNDRGLEETTNWYLDHKLIT